MKTVAICVLLAGALAFGSAQSSVDHDRKVIARIGYENTFVVSSREWKSPNTCFALYEGGYYRLARLTEFDGWEELHGKLGNADLEKLQSMLHRIEFPNRGGMVRSGAERFVAEIERDGQVRRFSWLNPDHKRPLPTPAAETAEWLQSFTPDDTPTRVWQDLSDDPICPVGETLPLQRNARAF